MSVAVPLNAPRRPGRAVRIAAPACDERSKCGAPQRERGYLASCPVVGFSYWIQTSTDLGDAALARRVVSTRRDVMCAHFELAYVDIRSPDDLSKLLEALQRFILQPLFTPMAAVQQRAAFSGCRIR